jgi:hypothetical protein
MILVGGGVVRGKAFALKEMATVYMGKRSGIVI